MVSGHWGEKRNLLVRFFFFFFKTSAFLHLKASSACSVFVVGLLLARAGDAVLWLGGARAQAVQPPAVLCVVNVVLKEKLQESTNTTYRVINGPYFAKLTKHL